MKTSPNTWKTALNQWWNQRRAEAGNQGRIAIVGVGNFERSDDAAGILVARGLLYGRHGALPEHILVIDAGHAPENSTGELRRFGPQGVLFVDAAEMGEVPGTIRWIETDEISGMSASTHSLPLSMLADYLTLEVDCRVAVLGIQPESNEVGEYVSESVRGAIAEVEKLLREEMRVG